MLNNNTRKNALKEYESVFKEHELINKQVTIVSETLFKHRNKLKENIENVWETLNKIRNTPSILEIELKEIKLAVDKYDEFLNTMQNEIEEAYKASAGVVGTGVIAGAGVAALGPSAAMAIATTFGTASTGTAISTLSGAAATNAALAWLGGGSLVAGGGGTAAGTALLGLAGPVGWAISGTALTGAALFHSSKNKKAAKQAYEETLKLRATNKTLNGINKEISEEMKITKETISLYEGFSENVINELTKYNMDYLKIKNDNNHNLLNNLGSLINQTNAAISLINKPIGQEIEKLDDDNFENSDFIY